MSVLLRSVALGLAMGAGALALRPQPAASLQAVPSPALAQAPVPAQAPPRWVETPTYLAARELFTGLPARPGAVVFLGDSLSASIQWHELLGRSDVLNRGIHRDTTEGVRLRLAEVLRHRPRKIFLLVGINDLIREGLSLPALVAGWRAILRDVQLRSPETQVFVQSLLPVNRALSAGLPANLEATIAAANSELARLADGRRIVYVDIHTTMLARPSLLHPRLSPDGIHLNALGYARWRAIVMPLLDP